MPFLDARKLAQHAKIETDVCIVGAGAAGITLARELCGQPLRVLLLESGGFSFSHRPQLLYRGENVGMETFSTSRSRYRMFGGSTYRWAGQSCPMSELDFEQRDWIPDSGWPFNRDHLEPYYRRAQSVCKLGDHCYEPSAWSSADKLVLPVDSTRLTTRIYQFGYPLEFGRTYRDELTRSTNVDVYLHANVVDIEMAQHAESVKSLQVATFNGRRCSVTAKAFILATGGIENPRLLLASNRVAKAGIGNQYDLVGRYYMDHPYFHTGYYEPAQECYDRSLHVIEDYSRTGSEQRVVAGFTLGEELLRAEGLNSCAIYFVRRPNYKSLPEYFAPGNKSFIRLLDVLKHNELPDGQFRRHIRNIIGGFKDVRVSLRRHLIELIRRRQRISLRAVMEPRPMRDSRITLSDRRDHFGMPRVRVDWKLHPKDKDGIVRVHTELQREIESRRLGRLVVDLSENETGWPNSITGGAHHMGTTRMHRDPKKGVVDANCRVHGTTNLYIAGSSVFPTASFAHPTFTIVALAIRLADHLRSEIHS